MGGGTGTGTGTNPAPISAATARANRQLDGSLNLGMRQAGRFSGAYVVDLTANRTLYSRNAGTGRLPASVEKLYTTTTALQRFGPGGSLTTSLLGQGTQDGGTFTGTLYLRGGGDPTFGSSGFDTANYGTGASPGGTGGGVADRDRDHRSSRATSWPTRRSSTQTAAPRPPATSPPVDVEGELSALAYDRGWANNTGTAYFRHPAVQAGQDLVAALKAAGVRLPRHLKVTAGRDTGERHDHGQRALAARWPPWCR